MNAIQLSDIVGGRLPRTQRACIECGVVQEFISGCVAHCKTCYAARRLTDRELGIIVDGGTWSDVLEDREQHSAPGRPKRWSAYERLIGVPAAFADARPSDAVMTWVGNPRYPLTLTGPVGRGKSWEAAGGMHALVRRSEFGNGVWLSCANLQRMDTAGIAQAIGSLVLVLDDLGSRLTPGALATAFELIDARTANRKPLIVTTNMSANDLSALDERLESRLNGPWIVLSGPDRRATP